MQTTPLPPRNDLSHLFAEARTQLPRLFGSTRWLGAGLVGPDRLDGATRVAVWLRLSRLLGCPVCRRLFPALGPRVGLGPEAIRGALDGADDAGLSRQARAAVAWAEAVVAAGGAEPSELPPAALDLTLPQRQHILFFVRLELVVHATGLFFLPHTWLQRAAAE